MKKITTTIIALAMLLSSCSETTEAKDENTGTHKTEEVTETSVEEVEEEFIPEGAEVEEDHRYDNMSTESASSECYIVSHFTDMDITYVTVDFITIEENTDSEGYEIINDNKKLRTFVVNEEYLNPYHEENVSIDDIFEKASDDPEIMFSITIEDGLVSELYENLAG
jgi:hypothetical protein